MTTMTMMTKITMMTMMAMHCNDGNGKSYCVVKCLLNDKRKKLSYSERTNYRVIKSKRS